MFPPIEGRLNPRAVSASPRSLYGEAGMDRLYGFEGIDDLRGGPDQDKLVGGLGVNTCQKEDDSPLLPCGGP